MLKLNGYGEPQAKVNEKSQCFKGWETLDFDTETGSSPSIVRGNHGVACAGIIGASGNNAIGIRGVAPNARLMSISNSLEAAPMSRIKRGEGINWAVQNGADIISESKSRANGD